ncbi:hypothetical protein [Bacillus cereus]|uniref:Uncharacterized protein n=1 Tax=Bacillus cereus VD184 TaxID=1053242 RepID=A0A9W5VRG8_BACCE|nr:hypothetical protein [Bacillus cereus]EOQ06903.1 hypothetical protein IKC_00791 [Bacillus cereus VD184]
MIEIALKSGRSLGWIFDTDQEMQKTWEEMKKADYTKKGAIECNGTLIPYTSIEFLKLKKTQ